MLCMWDTNITMLKMIFAMIIKICKMEGLQQYSLGLFEKIFLFLSINKAIMMSATIIKGRNTGFFTVLRLCTNIRYITISSTLTTILNCNKEKNPLTLNYKFFTPSWFNNNSYFYFLILKLGNRYQNIHYSIREFIFRYYFKKIVYLVWHPFDFTSKNVRIRDAAKIVCLKQKMVVFSSQ